MAVYEQILPTGAPLITPLGFNFAQTVYPDRMIDDADWTANGIPACQAALNQGDRIGFLFFRRSGAPHWNAGINNFDMDDPTKDYLCTAYSIPTQTTQNWLPGIMIRDYHRMQFGFLSSDGNNRKVTRLWQATKGGAEFDIKSGEKIFQANRAKHPLVLASSETAKARHVGGAEGRAQSEADGWGWAGTFAPATTPWVAAQPRRPTPWVAARPSGH